MNIATIIKENIKNRQYKDALENLEKTNKKYSFSYEHDIIMLWSSYHSLEEDKDKGIESKETIAMFEARLKDRMLRLLEKIIEELPADLPHVEKSELSPNVPNICIYISYAWADGQYVDEIDKAFISKGIVLKRDKREVEYKDSIMDYMKELGNGSQIIVVVSDAYLKSDNCGFEFLRMLSHNDYKDRIFPVVLETGRAIFNPLKSLQYLTFWESKIAELDEEIRKLKVLANAKRFYEILSRYQNIRSSISEFMEVVSDMNTLNYETIKSNGFEVLIQGLSH